MWHKTSALIYPHLFFKSNCLWKPYVLGIFCVQIMTLSKYCWMALGKVCLKFHDNALNSMAWQIELSCQVARRLILNKEELSFLKLYHVSPYFDDFQMTLYEAKYTWHMISIQHFTIDAFPLLNAVYLDVAKINSGLCFCKKMSFDFFLSVCICVNYLLIRCVIALAKVTYFLCQWGFSCWCTQYIA